MPRFVAPIDMQKNEIRNARWHNLPSAPSNPAEGQAYYDSILKNILFWNGTEWLKNYNADMPPSGPAGGDLVGTYPDPEVGSGVIDDANISPTAAIALSKLAVNPLVRSNHTGTQLAATISDFDAQVRTSRLDQLAAPTATLAAGNQRITGLADPTSPQDAATKAYVDALSMGLDPKGSVRVATTGNITLSGTQTIDGVALAVGDRVLVKNQTNATQNGVYTVASGTWQRATDANTSAKVTAGLFTFVTEGTTNGDSGWILITDDTITLDTTNLTFTQFTGAGQINAGAGLAKTGNTLDIGGTTDRISVGTDAIDIATTYVGQTSITTVGTITNGTWQGTAIAINKGGTGATSAAAARSNLGVVGKFAAANGGTATDSLTHNLNTQDVHVAVREIATGQILEADVLVVDANSINVQYATAPAASSLRITVIG